MEVGALPKDLGLIDLNPSEMLFWMYCPISIPSLLKGFVIPRNLGVFEPIVRAARMSDPARFRDEYVYLTAKTLWVSGDYIGNRPGWHTDGFGTDDLNFIWSDRAPTQFFHQFPMATISDDCAESMVEMELLADGVYGPYISPLTYPDKHLLRLDPSVMHRSPVFFAEGMRTFVKVSISKHRYDLVGNSINHVFGPLGPMVERKLERNHPASGTLDV